MANIINSDDNLIKDIDSSIRLEVPSFIETSTMAEIIVDMKNNTHKMITGIQVDLSNLEEYFMIEGEAKVNTLAPGMELESRINIKPKFEKGVFPIKIKITGSGTTIEKQYTIKVGGTEIY